MFGPVVTTEAHLAFSGARTHSNNTAEMIAMIEALSFLGPHRPVTRDEQSCIYYDSLHAAGICLGTIQARTHVQLALACQQSMIHAQHRRSLTMQQVYGHCGNLGNECADHAAALGTFGLTSSHNVATRWIHHNFDASVYLDGCNNISEVVERLQHLRTRAIIISQEVDLLVGDLPAWRHRGKDNLSTTDEALVSCPGHGATPLWGLGSIPDNWADVCGFLKPPGSQRFWKVNKHGAFSIPRKTLGLRPNDQSCHHETWLHLDFVDWSNTSSRQHACEPRISLKERPAECTHKNPKRRISEIISDHSLSS